MEYRYLGKTGLKVSELCLGTMTFGRETEEEASHDIMDRFATAGGNFIDTADVYSQGVSEQIVGRWLKNQRREDFVIATKVRFGMGNGVNDVGLSRKHIMDGVHESLRRLNVDSIDLYQVHCWDAGTPLEETLSTLDSLVKSGKVRYIGASNFKGWQLQKAVDISNFNHMEPFICLQPLYNLLDRAIEWDLIEVCMNEGLGVIPWSPLRGGWLSGKFRRGMSVENLPQDTRIADSVNQTISERWDVYNTERTWTIIDNLLEVAEKCGKEPSQVALNWVKDRPGVTAPIIGVRTMQHLESNLGAVGWTMDAELRQQLDDITAINAPYPHDFVGRNAVARARK